jgi:hypothetical protein
MWHGRDGHTQRCHLLSQSTSIDCVHCHSRWWGIRVCSLIACLASWRSSFLRPFENNGCAGAYHYWVPAAVLGMRVPDPVATPMQQDAADSSTPAETQTDINAGLSAEDIAHNAAVLARLRQTLQAFQGDRAFHNYTKRQRYTPAKNRPQRPNYSRKRAKSMAASVASSNAAEGASGPLADAAPPVTTDNVEESPAGACTTCTACMFCDCIMGNEMSVLLLLLFVGTPACTQRTNFQSGQPS